ncbi:TPA: hypothetical protein R1938_002487, partial [Staphylococcus delphini]|nr:hypothetical protein [Staphylococcus delphini]
FVVFLFSGFTSPLIAYYSNDIISSFSNSNTKIIFADPKWTDLILSYFKNVSQLVMFITAYIIGDTCRIGKDKSIQLYYKTRARNSGRILYPKILVSLIVVTLGALFGSLSALYTTWIYFDDFNLNHAIQGLFVQIIGILIFSIFSGVIAFWINSAFVAALIVEIFIFIAMFFASIEEFQKWSPVTLLKPQNVLIEGINTTNLWYPLIIGGLVCLILIIVSFYRPLRRKTIK